MSKSPNSTLPDPMFNGPVPMITYRYRSARNCRYGTIFKGIVPQDLRLQVFFMNQFLLVPEYPI